MSENEIKKAFDEIEPEIGAQERMYANILKKAAAQSGEKAMKNESTPERWCRCPPGVQHRFGSAAVRWRPVFCWLWACFIRTF